MALVLIGIIALVLFWFKGRVEEESESLHRKIAIASERVWEVIFSRKFFVLLKTFFLDIILQRKLLQESVRRWFLHSLIYSSILLRFSLGLFTLVVFNLWPRTPLAMALIDKNYPFVAFVNDLLGLLILVGVCWAAASRFITKPRHVVSEFQDNVALLILGTLTVLGFIVEGARIVMSHVPEATAHYSFVGFSISLLFSRFGFHWEALYELLWYAHALVGALFIAYLPFGKMKHIITTPLNLLISGEN